MTRPPTLTDRQIQIIRENLDLFPADILKLPEFADTDVTRHTIRNYQRRLKNAAVIGRRRGPPHTPETIYEPVWSRITVPRPARSHRVHPAPGNQDPFTRD